jgi:tRNA-2-methylthio-N6-dimethylallyladenosine synthase
LPNLLAEVEGRDAINVILSKDETYGDISPVRLIMALLL